MYLSRGRAGACAAACAAAAAAVAAAVVYLEVLLPLPYQGELLCQAGSLCGLALADFGAAFDRTIPASVAAEFEERKDQEAFCLRPPAATWRALMRRLEQRRRSGQRPTVVHIGPNDLMRKAELEEVDEILAESARIVLVEPQPSIADALQRTFAPPRHRADQVDIVRSAICETDAADITFFTFSPNLTKDFPLLRLDDFTATASLDRTHCVENIRRGLPKQANKGNYTEAEWASFESYIVETKVRCLSLAGLLRELGIQPADVDGFIVDAEGFDRAILRQALRLEGFSPAFVKFEWIGHSGHLNQSFWSSDLSPLINWMVALGYDVYLAANDIVAALREPS